MESIPYFQKSSKTWPIGESQPPGNEHAISVSLPSWKAVIGWSRREAWVVTQMKCGYPRLYINKIIQKLGEAVVCRFNLSDIACLIFPSSGGSSRCVDFLHRKQSDATIHTATFHFSQPLPPGWTDADAGWAEFYAVLFPKDILKEALAFWRQTGDGISSRHAQLCFQLLDHLESSSSIFGLRTAPTQANTNVPISLRPESAESERQVIRSFIAELATSENQQKLATGDVFLYQKGLSGIYAVSRALIKIAASSERPRAVIYGWPYAETVKCIELSGWSQITMYGRGTDAELDELEKELENGGRIDSLFCELPSNPQLASPDIERIYRLANKYDFIVACDETLGTFVNVDVLPYVDIVMTSLTKIFSGASDVMGGSVIVNPRSRHHDSIHTVLTSEYEDTYFSADIKILSRNCTTFVPRVHLSNQSAQTISHLLSIHPSIAHVNYPSVVPTRPYYDKCKRPGGGYGFLMSMIFHHPEAAVCFYDNLNVAKGPSLGTNFTLAIPYAQLAHFHEQDWAEEYDVPRHIVRISVGLEDEGKLVETVSYALKMVEELKVCGSQENGLPK